jgi:hypothetical protein
MQQPDQRSTHRNPRPLASGLLASASALLFALVAPGSARADSDDRAATPDELTRVRTELESKGYSDVHDLEVDDGRFEVDARNARGEKVDLELDINSLAILHEDLD